MDMPTFVSQLADGTLNNNQQFNDRLKSNAEHEAVLNLLRQNRDINILHLIALIVLAGLSLLAVGCDQEKTFVTVNHERQRIADELAREFGKELSADRLEALKIIVHARPRTAPETKTRAFDMAKARVDQERIALGSAEAAFRGKLRSPANPSATAPLPQDLVAWQEHVKRARRILLVLEAARAADDWGPVAHILVAEELQNTPAKLGIPSWPDELQLNRARASFAKLLAELQEVKP